MRKFLASLLLLVTMLPFAAKAEELTVYEGTATNRLVPMYVYYFDAFTRSQYVIPAADLAGMAGSSISSIKYYTSLTAAYTTLPEVDVYLKEVDYTTISAYIAKTDATIVYHGKISFAANGEAVIEFNSPFEYNGGNLLIGVENLTDAGYKNVSFYGTSNVTGASIAGQTGSSTGTIPATQQNFIPKTTFTFFNGIELTSNPATLNMGYRPNNAWMAPYLFEIINSGLPGTISSIEANAPFVVNAEVPVSLGNQETLEVEVTTAENNYTGSTTGEILLLLGNSKDFQTFDVTANFYTAETPDVWEKAQEVTTFPYTGNVPSNIYKNYDIPGANAAAKDAVYKIVLEEEAVLNVTTDGANPAVALYAEDFNGEDGPMATNTYSIGGSGGGTTPYSTWLYYDDGTYTGSMGAGGTLYWAVNFPASELTEAANCSVTKVQVYDAGYTGGTSSVLIYEDGELVYYQPFDFAGAQDWQEIVLDTPVAFDNTKDLMIAIYNTGITYPAAGCDYVSGIGDNGDLVSFDGEEWEPLSGYNFYYTWMIRGFVQTPDGAKTAELSHFKGNVSTGELSEMVAATPVVTRPINRADTPSGATSIEDMFLPAGTYYAVVSSTTDKFGVNISTSEVPAPEQPVVTSPEDGAFNVTAPVTLTWELGNYTSAMKVLFGTQYNPTDVLIDWTDDIVTSYQVTSLLHNKQYFVKVIAANATDTVASEIVGFTTVIDGVTGFAVANDKLYPGDAAEFSWEANRALQGYNLYQDGVKVNEEPITTTSYAVEGLEYNMTGYNFQIAALYGEGESELSEPIVVKMTGFGNVSGTVYEQDETTPVPGITVEYRGTDEHGANQSFTFTTDENGDYAGEVLAGNYQTYAYSDAYQESPGPAVTVAYGDELDGIDIIVYEFYFPLGQITATEQTEDNNVLVEWDWTPGELIVDFETGDFSQADFTLPATYPWAITNTNAHEGTYCMKSTCEGIASGTSEIEVTVDVPFDAKMGFYVKTSTESNYDKFFFYIDGVPQGAAISGTTSYTYKEYALSAGTHTYKWSYQKDSSVNSGDDCVYVDDITMYRQDIPAPPIVGATDYNFDDGTMMGWTSLDANNDGYGWVLGSQIGGVYLVSGASLAGSGHNSSEDMVCSGSFSNATQSAITPDNYLVSPTKIAAEDGALINFWACAQDASYAAEVFGVAVSTASNTNAADFTMVAGPWTMTAKRAATAEKAFRGDGKDQGAWYQYTADLSSYAGQEIWVAIRHYDCNDMFILNVDDITVATGGSKNIVRNDRSFQHFNLYRRDIKDGEETAEAVCIAQPAADVFEYIDNDWANLPYGAYQWGIQAYYEGNAPAKSRDEFTYDFEGDLDGWTVLTINSDGGEWVHSSANPGGYFYNTLAHGGTGFAMCYSFVDYVGSFDTDSYLISPQKYSLDGSSTISFWADNANDDYPEEFSVCISTAANPTSAADFTQVWGGEAKGKAKGGEMVRHTTNRYENWRSHSVDLSAYAGQEVWIAFHDVNYDAYEIWIDDVTITAGGGGTTPVIPTPTGDGLSEIIWSNTIEKDMYSTVTVNVTLNNGQAPVGVAVALGDLNGTTDENGTVVFEQVRKGEYELSATMAEFGDYTETVMIDDNEETFDITLMEIVGPVADLYVSPTGWAMWSGAANNGGGGGGGGGGGNASTFTEGFEGGMPAGWTVIDANNDNWTWCLTSAIPTTWTYYASMSLDWYRTGTNAICSGSYINGVGALTPDEYLVTPQVTLTSGSTFTFWAAATDASYPADHFGVFVSDNGTSGWTSVQEWTLTGKSGGTDGGRASRDGNGAKLGTWYQYTADLGAYAGQKYIAIRHFNCNDEYIMCVDDIELAAGSKGERGALSFKVMLDGVYEGETTNGYFQHNVEGFEEGSVHTTSVAGIYATGMGDWTDYTWTYTSCENFASATNVTAEQSENVVNISWVMPDGTGPTPPPTPGTGQWYYYGDDTQTTGVGAGGAFYWAVMFPAGSYQGNMVTKVANYGAHDDMYGTNGAFSGTVTIYNDGTTTPANAVGTMNITMPDTDQLVEFEFPTPVTIDPSKNLWVVFYNSNSTDYVGSCCNDSGDPNGRWVSLDGAEWLDLAAAGVAGYNWMIKAYVASGSKENVVSILDPMKPISNPGTLAKSPRGNRAMWDYVASFSGTSAGQQAVATDGNYIYTASWQATPTGGHTFYQYDLEGNFIEGFDIAGATGIRDLTTDGEYFYGSSGGAQIFCMDFTTRTLVSTINCSGLTSRHLSYDPERDGFWSGNWSTLALYSRSGSLIQNGAAPESAYGSAYYKDADGVEHLYMFCQPNSDAKVYDYNIATNTISGPVFDFAQTPGCASDAIAGGCFVGSYDGKTCWFGNAQMSPNLIGIYELDGNGTPGPGPGPGPSGEFGILGAYVFRNGELISGTTPLTTNSFVDENAPAGDNEYCVRVVYDGAPDTSYYAMSCPVCAEAAYECIPVNNLVAEYTYNSSDDYGVTLTWDCEHADDVLYYNVYYSDTIVTGVTELEYYVEMTGNPGEYTFSVTAVYPNCESEPVYADVNVTSVNDVTNQMVLYPNPTNSTVTIEAAGMKHITVVNALGQMIYDADINADMTQLNLGQYTPGVYMVRINTEEGVGVKRVTVVK